MPLKTVEIATNIVSVVYATTAAVRCVAHSCMFLLTMLGGEEANGEGGREMGPLHGLCPTYHAGAAGVCSGTVEVGICPMAEHEKRAIADNREATL